MFIQIDLANFGQYGPVTTDAVGTVFFTMSLNLPPSFAGEEVMVQMFIDTPVDTSTDVRSNPDRQPNVNFEVTNGLRMTLGIE